MDYVRGQSTASPARLAPLVPDWTSRLLDHRSSGSFEWRDGRVRRGHSAIARVVDMHRRRLDGACRRTSAVGDDAKRRISTRWGAPRLGLWRDGRSEPRRTHALLRRLARRRWVDVALARSSPRVHVWSAGSSADVQPLLISSDHAEVQNRSTGRELRATIVGRRR